MKSTIKRMAGLFSALAILMGAGAASAQEQSSPFDQLEKEAIEKIVREYLLEHPEIIIESVRKLEERQRAAEAERSREALVASKDLLENDPTSPIMGNPEGDVTIVEFFDYRCPYCRRMLEPMRELLAGDPGVRWVFKEFPILGPESLYAARAALAAHKQGKYDEFHLALMADGVKVTNETVDRIASGLGLDMERLKKDMETDETDEILGKNHALATELGITGTPAFVIGDKLIPGAVGLTQLRQAIAEARDGSG